MGFDLGSLFPVAGAAIGGYFGGLPGAAAGGSIGGMMSSQLGAKDANQESLQNAREGRDWQDRMRRTNHQAEVEDLKAAGLNPLLAANGGASAPSTSSPTAQNPNAGMGTAFSDAVNSAIAVRDMKNKNALAQVTIDNTSQDTENKKAMQALTENQQRATAKDIEQKTYSNEILKKTLDSQIKKAKADGDYAELNQLMGVINSGASSVNQLVNPLKMFKPSKDSAKDFLNPK